MKHIFNPWAVLVLLVLIATSCQQDPVLNEKTGLDQELEGTIIAAGGLDHFKLPAADDFNNIPQDPRNPLTAAKVDLGKLLYHETGLALAPVMGFAEGTYSCASCHFADAGFAAGRWQGIGEGAVGFGINGEGRARNGIYEENQLDVQPLKSPTVLNTAYQEVMLWNGQFGATGLNAGTEALWTAGTPKADNHFGYQGLEIQAIAGLSVHRLKIDPNFLENLGYKEHFDAVFGDWEESRRYSRESAGLAIAAYERTLMADQAPFQNWLRGNYDALSELEKEGAMVFFGKANCVTCHTGPALNNMDFHALGMGDLNECPEPVFRTPADDLAHLGRGGFTGNQEDNYKFKTPTLYNLKDSPFYGHGSSFRSVEEVVEYKNKAEKQSSKVPMAQLDANFVPLNLSSHEVKAITAFIEGGLHDPNLRRYQPNAVLSGNCFPNADPMSMSQLGCN